MAPATILVVDDDARVLDFVATVLRAENYTVTTATNGREALALLAEHHYDVVVSNMGMPELDGPGLYREIQRVRPARVPPFLFITGDYTKPNYVWFFEEAGVPSLGKPFSHSALIQAGARMIGSG